MTDATTIQVRRDDGIVHIELLDRELVDNEKVQSTAGEIARLIEAEPKPRMVISFANVQLVSSDMLGSLIDTHNRVRSRGGQLRLAAIGPRLQHLLAVTRLSGLFEIHTTPEEAAASMK